MSGNKSIDSNEKEILEENNDQKYGMGDEDNDIEIIDGEWLNIC
jgi:hypothetical protein